MCEAWHVREWAECEGGFFENVEDVISIVNKYRYNDSERR